MKELQKNIVEIYLVGEKTISTGVLFFTENIKRDFQMDAAEFEGLLYPILSEEPFKNQSFRMIE